MNWFITSLVRTQFLEYDRKILHSSGILMDGLTCVYRCLLCGAAITIVLGCAIAGGFVACLAFYFSLTTGNVYVPIGAGIELYISASIAVVAVLATLVAVTFCKVAILKRVKKEE